MSKWEWRVDPGTHVVLRKPPFFGRKVQLNGQRVEGTWNSKRFDFVLPDGRSANIILKAEALSGQTELVIDGKFVPDSRYVPKDLRCPACKAEIQVLDEFCTRCGHKLGDTSRFIHQHSVQGATTAIYVLAAVYAIWGVVNFLLQRDDVAAALTHLMQFADYDIVSAMDDKSYTAGELRNLVLWQHRGTLGVHLILSALMLVLAWWSRRSPLPAILVAMALFVVLQVVAAIIEPRSLVSGWLIKAIVIVVLVKGIKGALEMRAAHG